MIFQKFSKHTGELLTELSCLCTGTRSKFLCGAAGDPCSGEGAACPPWPPGPEHPAALSAKHGHVELGNTTPCRSCCILVSLSALFQRCQSSLAVLKIWLHLFFSIAGNWYWEFSGLALSKGQSTKKRPPREVSLTCPKLRPCTLKCRISQVYLTLPRFSTFFIRQFPGIAFPH